MSVHIIILLIAIPGSGLPRTHVCRRKMHNPNKTQHAIPSHNMVSEIPGELYPRGVKLASDSVHTSAQGVETCLRFRAYLCTGGRNPPRIQGISMHRGQKLAPVSRHIYAQGAETCLRFWAYLCTGGRDVTEILGISMPGVHNLPRDLGHTSARCA